MTTTKKASASLIVSAIVGGIAFMVAAPDLATGRDRTAGLLFPYAFWVMRWVLSDRLFILLVFAQFPIYGLAFARAWCRDRPEKAFLWIWCMHFAFAASLSYLNSVERSYQTWPGN